MTACTAPTPSTLTSGARPLLPHARADEAGGDGEDGAVAPHAELANATRLLCTHTPGDNNAVACKVRALRLLP